MQICPARCPWQTLVNGFLFVPLLPFCSRQNYANICQGDVDDDAMPKAMSTERQQQMKISAGLFILFLCTLLNTSVCQRSYAPGFLRVPAPCKCNCNCRNIRHSPKHSWREWQALGRGNSNSKLTWLGLALLGSANTFFAPQKCWRRFVVHLEMWGRPSAAGCCCCKKENPNLQQPLSVLGTRQSVASVGLFVSLSLWLLLPFVAFWRLAVGRCWLWHFDWFLLTFGSRKYLVILLANKPLHQQF